jgi:hypothetical protein
MGAVRKKRWLMLLLVVALMLGGCSDSGGSSGNDSSTTQRETSGDAAADSGASTDSGGSTAGSESEPADGRDGASDRNSFGEPVIIDGDGSEYGGGRGNPEPQAGMLTAGEWADTDKWDDWLGLLNGREGDKNQKYWSFYRFDRLLIEVNAGNLPAVDAAVLVKNEQGETVWEARTDVNGKAYAFAGLFAKKSPHGDYSVEIRHGSQVKQFENVKLPREHLLKVTLDKAVPLSGNVDLMFVVDTTGSMQDELDYLEAELGDVIDRVRGEGGQQLGIGVSTAFYRDANDEYTVRAFPFTDNVDKAVQLISDQSAKGGGDYPEAVDEALAKVLDHGDWSTDARARLLFLVLDAPPHHEDGIVDRMHELTRKAAKLGVRIVPVASSGVDVETEYLMRFMAASTGGTYVFLTDHSGIGREHLEPAVGEYEVHALNELLADIIRRFTRPANGSE